MLVTDIKNKIKEKIEALVPATLGEVQVDDFKLMPWERDFAKYPAAVVSTPVITSDYLTNRANIRTHTFTIIVMMKAEDVTSANDVETLIETILNAFDNDPTLGGTADGAVEPSASQPEAIVSRGKNLIAHQLARRIRHSVHAITQTAE